MLNYLKLTEACQTKAKRKNSKGITGIISTIGFKKAQASGNLAKKKLFEERAELNQIQIKLKILSITNVLFFCFVLEDNCIYFD